MRLIVGLGNPGPEYEWTPHNMGFLAVDYLAPRVVEGIDTSFYEKTLGSYLKRVGDKPKPAKWHSTREAAIEKGFLAGKEIVIAKPNTYMNNSGKSVYALMTKFRISPKDLIVVSDEFSLPWGHIRIRTRGSAGGHKGMKSVIDELGTEEFPRVRIGVNPGFPIDDLSEYVLQRLGVRNRGFVEQMAMIAADSVASIVTKGETWAMGKYNNKEFSPTQ